MALIGSILSQRTARGDAGPVVPSPAIIPGMVLEHALLDVTPGREAEFEEVFGWAKAVIAASPGFRSLQLQRCLERPGRYLLLVEWETLAAHVEGFRGSPAYEEWREALHHFYAPMPTVEHYEVVHEA
jgi:heme-degrading monooxygenase HmoA